MTREEAKKKFIKLDKELAEVNFEMLTSPEKRQQLEPVRQQKIEEMRKLRMMFEKEV